MIIVENPLTKKKRRVRMLLDCGSQKSYISEHIAKELGLKSKETVRVNHQLFGGAEVVGQPHKIYNLKVGDLNGTYALSIPLMDQPRICGGVSRVAEGQWMEELRRRGILLNDVDPSDSTEIDLLMGADYLGEILTGGIIQLQNGLTATETKFGWTIMGKQKANRSFAMTSLTMTLTSSTVEELWRLETIGIMDPIEVKSKEVKEQEVKDHFVKTVRRNKDGRYSVSLPWISDSITIPSNYAVAEKRLQSTTRKLNSIDKFHAYHSVFEDWKKEGIISTVDKKITGDECHYIPHRAVIKESRTTPVRPVFDASCKVGGSPSLNNCLEKGPNLLELIPSIILRFRMGKIGMLADIRKAFLMVDVNPEDRKYLRFLWWESGAQTNIQIYQHNRVVFGVNCSPFLLSAVISYHLDQFRQIHPEIIGRIENSIYVDNLVMAVDNLQQYEEVKAIATETMEKACMELRDWEHSGSSEAEDVTGVLGLKWDKASDTLFCDILFAESPPTITKRIILSQIQRIFDPLGLLSAVVIVPKILLQQSWVENKRWDETVGEGVAKQFQDWWTELLAVMKNIRIPRNFITQDLKDCQFHVFCDACKKAYAAVVFLRGETGEGEAILHFVQAKARVAPLKSATIPRLELLSCTIATRIMKSVTMATGMEEVPVTYWSDSTTALAWIKRQDEWGTFVGNRVKEISLHTKPNQWRHVPGKMNPADIPSRGISPSKFLELRWWEGPDWLKLDKSNWPHIEGPVNQERKRISTLTSQSVEIPWYCRGHDHSSNVRIMAWGLRFIKSCRLKTRERSQSLTTEELGAAENRLFRLLQKESFPTGSQVISDLRVEQDSEGLLRVKTKLLHRMDSENFKRPILLPNAHPLVEAMIREEHETNSHAGIQFLMGKIREKAWIIHGRRAIKRVTQKCVKCRRFDSTKPNVPLAALPEDRVKNASAFEVTGIDLAGPLMLKTKKKVYIVLFTCAIYRGIHLELTESLSTEDFLLAFVRFCKRKRRPSIVYTDNGTNFVGAVNLFKQIDWKEVERRNKQLRITWRFNPPSAPWWGGWWERLVRSVKDLLRRMLGFRKLSYAELETSLCEVESAINNRPLTYVTEDPEDLIPLTPAMFICNLPNDEVPESEVITVSLLENRRKKLGTLLRELRDRFRKEYLGQLVQRGKEKNIREFQVGEVVLIEMDNQKRVHWPMGRIQQLMEGKDGGVRMACVKTRSGDLLRPLQRLYPLEVTPEEIPTLQNVEAEKEQEVQERTEPQERPEPEKRPEVQERPEPQERPEVQERREVLEDQAPNRIARTRSGRNVKKPARFAE